MTNIADLRAQFETLNAELEAAIAAKKEAVLNDNQLRIGPWTADDDSFDRCDWAHRAMTEFMTGAFGPQIREQT